MPRFMRVSGNKVVYVLPAEKADEYPILLKGDIEIPLDSPIKEGWIYDSTIKDYREQTKEEKQTEYRPMFNEKRKSLFAQTGWARERFQDAQRMHEDGLITEEEYNIAKEKYKKWLIYWQELRDMPQQPDFDTENPNFPEMPE